jgi:hypothetical protein
MMSFAEKPREKIEVSQRGMKDEAAGRTGDASLMVRQSPSSARVVYFDSNCLCCTFFFSDVCFWTIYEKGKTKSLPVEQASCDLERHRRERENRHSLNVRQRLTS